MIGTVMDAAKPTACWNCAQTSPARGLWVVRRLPKREPEAPAIRGLAPNWRYAA
jgi:hypothetical protein